MSEPKPKRAKRVKPNPELVKLADSLLGNYRKTEDLGFELGLITNEPALSASMCIASLPTALRATEELRSATPLPAFCRATQRLALDRAC